MKNLYYALIITLTMSSCSMFRRPVLLVSTALDYSIYQKKGFFLTESNSVSFAYEPIASVSALNISGYEISDKPSKTYTDDIYGTTEQGEPRTTNIYIKAKKETVLEELYKKAISLEANGIINLNFKIIYLPSPKGGYDWGYEATGMAIKK